MLYVPLLAGETLKEKVFFLQNQKTLVNSKYHGTHVDMVEGVNRDFLLFPRPVPEKSLFKQLRKGEILTMTTPKILSYYEINEDLAEIAIFYSVSMPLMNSDYSHYKSDEGRLTYFSLDSDKVLIKNI